MWFAIILLGNFASIIMRDTSYCLFSFLVMSFLGSGIQVIASVIDRIRSFSLLLYLRIICKGIGSSANVIKFWAKSYGLQLFFRGVLKLKKFNFFYLLLIYLVLYFLFSKFDNLCLWNLFILSKLSF